MATPDFRDAHLDPRVRMTPQELPTWTNAIDRFRRPGSISSNTQLEVHKTHETAGSSLILKLTFPVNNHLGANPSFRVFRGSPISVFGIISRPVAIDSRNRRLTHAGPWTFLARG
jgi:hypothetical protein